MARILVIEDDDMLRPFICAVLRDAGHTVIAATNGKEGLSCIQSLLPNLVITDLVMPEKEGIEVIIELRGKYPRMGIIAMSGASQAIYLTLASRLGASHTLAKPFPPHVLLAAVDKTLAQVAGNSAPISNAHVAVATGPQRFRFVILDDDADNRYLHRHTLERKFPGCTVVECGAPTEALKQCTEAHIDAVVTDHHLGEPDGAAFIKALREQHLQCPILMVTGNSNPAVHEQAYSAGATRVFGPGQPDFSEYLQKALNKS